MNMSATLVVALVIARCNLLGSATQCAISSALVVVCSVFRGPLPAYAVDAIEWSPFLISTFFTALPGTLPGFLLRREIDAFDRRLSFAS